MRPAPLALGLLLCASPALAAEPAGGKAAGKAAVPKFELALPGLPAIEVAKPKEGPAKALDGPPVLQKGLHARDFDANAGGRKPRGPELKEFRLKSLPATTEPFKTLVRLQRPGARPFKVAAALKTPQGAVLAEAEADVSFRYGEDTYELVLRWDGFLAKSAGTYVVEVQGDGLVLGTVPLEVVFGE